MRDEDYRRNEKEERRWKNKGVGLRTIVEYSLGGVKNSLVWRGRY
jgi:hypothetical protein